MNNKFIYIPISALVVISVVVITFEVPHYSMMIGFLKLVWTSLFSGIVFTAISKYTWWHNLLGEDLYVAIGSTFLFSTVIIFAFVSWSSRTFATQNCETGAYKMISYEARYKSGYGILDKEVVANQWLLTIVYENEKRTFSLEKNILNDDVTNHINLEFCNGMFSTKYLSY